MHDAPLMLSVSGLRGVVGASLTPPVAARYGAAVAHWIQQRAGKQYGSGVHGPHVVIGRDSRPSGPVIEMAVVASLRASGCRVTSLGIASTPGVAVMVRHLCADAGIVITASHNPIMWNGVKVIREDGAAPSAEQAHAIIAAFKHDQTAYVPAQQLGSHSENHTVVDVHAKLILDQVDVEAIRRRRLRVALESVHGAGGPETAALLAALGVELIHLYGEPTGQFPHEPEPTRANLTGLCAAVREHQADIGMAQDPDADRLALVDEKGVYIGEEYTLALTAMHLLTRRATGNRPAGELGDRKTPAGNLPVAPIPTVVTNLSTSRMLDDIARQCGATVVRTPVGEANVAAAMQRHHALIGGEGNGGVIWPVCSHVRDSMAGAALILELLALRNQTLSAVMNSIPAYAMVKDKVQLPAGAPLPPLTNLLPARFPEARCDLSDGVRLDWPNRWVHVRPSNTEPILRLIAEAPGEEAARRLIADVRRIL